MEKAEYKISPIKIVAALFTASIIPPTIFAVYIFALQIFIMPLDLSVGLGFGAYFYMWKAAFMESIVCSLLGLPLFLLFKCYKTKRTSASAGFFICFIPTAAFDLFLNHRINLHFMITYYMIGIIGALTGLAVRAVLQFTPRKS